MSGVIASTARAFIECPLEYAKVGLFVSINCWPRPFLLSLVYYRNLVESLNTFVRMLSFPILSDLLTNTQIVLGIRMLPASNSNCHTISIYTWGWVVQRLSTKVVRQMDYFQHSYIYSSSKYIPYMEYNVDVDSLQLSELNSACRLRRWTNWSASLK